MRELIGQKIVGVRPPNWKERKEFAEAFDGEVEVVIVLANAHKIFATADPEMNGPGHLLVMDNLLEVYDVTSTVGVP